MSDALEFIRNESMAGEEVAEMVDRLDARVDSLCDHLSNSQKQVTLLRSSLLASANYIDILGGNSFDQRRTLAATEPK